MKVTVVIPNYNGKNFLEPCLDSLAKQEYTDYCVIVVDNGSSDGSIQLLQEKYPKVQLIEFQENTGFDKAVNAGIKAAQTPYVLLLNNDTEVKSGFIQSLVEAFEEKEKSEKVFSISPQMLMHHNPELVDDAGDEYCAWGWAVARGKGKKSVSYMKAKEIFAACAGASLYSKKVIDEIGDFDEAHFAYLEDIDIGYRARIYGYKNFYEPKAQVLHVGSGFSGSRHNEFKVKLAAANNIYLIWKNMPLLQIIINLPFLLVGIIVKGLFFIRKGLGKAYFQGNIAGFKKCFDKENRGRKIRFKFKFFGNYIRIQCRLWGNLLVIFS